MGRINGRNGRARGSGGHEPVLHIDLVGHDGSGDQRPQIPLLRVSSRRVRTRLRARMVRLLSDGRAVWQVSHPASVVRVY